MGLLGLRRYIDASGCTHLIRPPVSDSTEADDDYPSFSEGYPTFHSSGGTNDFKKQKRRLTGGDTSNEKEEDWERNVASHASGYPEATAALSFSSSTAAFVPLADHVLIDLNCIVHSCLHACSSSCSPYEGEALEGCPKHMVFQAVLERLEELLTTIIIPVKSLTICLDGPPPFAKIQTQRLRRRKVSYMNGGGRGESGSGVHSNTNASERHSMGYGSDCYEDKNAQSLPSRRSSGSSSTNHQSADTVNGLAITAGSLFLVELENIIAAAFKKREGCGFLSRRCPVFLHGSTVAGEGESKISRGLAYLAYSLDSTPHESRVSSFASASRPPHSCTRGQKINRGKAAGDRREEADERNIKRKKNFFLNDGAPPYHPNDTIVVLGNDIDLVLTCIGATYYHNITVLSPSSLQCVHVGEMLYRWWKTANVHVGGFGDGSQAGNTFFAEALAPLRMDFIFLFLLNGGDHYEGVGDVAASLWSRYLTIRASSLSFLRPKKNSRVPGNSVATSSSSSSVQEEESFLFCLVHSDLNAIYMDRLAEVLQADQYSGDADPEVGIQLLESALWSLRTVVTGACPDYRYIPPLGIADGSGQEVHPHPTLSHLRAAALYCRQHRIQVQFPPTDRGKKTRKGKWEHKRSKEGKEQKKGWDSTHGAMQKNCHPTRNDGLSSSLPLTPLEHYVALMPTLSAFPKSIADTLGRSSSLSSVLHVLLTSHDPLAIANAATAAVEASSAALRLCERCLRQLTSPVQLNVLPPRIRLTRYAQHRLLALANKQQKKDSRASSLWSPPVSRHSLTRSGLLEEDPEPVVRIISLPPEDAPVVRLEYPPGIQGLTFHFPFARTNGSRELETNGNECRTEEKGGNPDAFRENEEENEKKKKTRRALKRKRSATSTSSKNEKEEESNLFETVALMETKKNKILNASVVPLLNSPSASFSPTSSAEGKTLYFSSFYSQRENGTPTENEGKNDNGTTWGTLEHKLTVAHRLKERGAQQTAKGTKMRKALRKIQSEIFHSVRKEAASDDKW